MVFGHFEHDFGLNFVIWIFFDLVFLCWEFSIIFGLFFVALVRNFILGPALPFLQKEEKVGRIR